MGLRIYLSISIINYLAQVPGVARGIFLNQIFVLNPLFILPMLLPRHSWVPSVSAHSVQPFGRL